MAYDLCRFSPQSFERFAQALATKQFGGGIQVFGAGPDGAREASFHGKCNITTHGGTWDGYIVIQAKYRAKPTRDENDLLWLIGQLKKDLKKFTDTRRALRKPDYYLLITNLHLTGGAKNSEGKRAGGIDKIDEAISELAEKIGLKGWHVWHEDLISSFLDSSPEICSKFSNWVTVGDVLSAALARLSMPNFSTVIQRVIRDDLRRYRNIRTKDAGQVSDKAIFLDEVFVDLPISKEDLSRTLPDIAQGVDASESVDSADDPDEGPPNEDGETETDHPRIVATIMERLCDKLDPESCERHEGLKRQRKRPLANRIVLLGGPGQGKSTVGQFIAQVCRARLIKASSARSTREVDRAAKSVLDRSRAENIPLTGPSRFPLHIDLPKFADALNGATEAGSGLSILKFAADILSRGADEAVAPNDLRRWLSEYPSIIILDGLDEVPPSSNRSEVILATEALLDALLEVNADALILTTTRPQGYNNDLSRRDWSHWPMANLSDLDALRVAERLSSVLISEDTRREEILGTMKKAAAESATATLMISPLQVGILFSLIETRNDIPTDRWSLFSKHYEILRDREIGKGGLSGELLRTYQNQVDQIHHDAGLILHIWAEERGNANAYFKRDDFKNIIRQQLLIDEFPGEIIDSIADQLAVIATDRLVFLGCRTQDQIAFDVRSLQEFMAAASLMSSPEEKIKDRLTEIASKPHWRHVFRIACSKVYSQTNLRALRPEICSILDKLDSGDITREDALVRTGASLALELLVDGIAGNLPAQRKALVARSLRLLDIGSNDNEVLAKFIDDNTFEIFERVTSQKLSDENGKAFEFSYELLQQIHRNEKFRPWSESFLIRKLPYSPERSLYLFEDSEIEIRGALANALVAKQWASTPRDVSYWRRDHPGRGAEFTDTCHILSPEMRKFFQSSDEVVTPFKLSQPNGSLAETNLHLGFRPISTFPIDFTITATDFCPAWMLLVAASAFAASPSTESLVRFLALVEEKALLKDSKNLALPWPLRAILDRCPDSNSVRSALELAAVGKLGTAEKWASAEQRWSSRGFSDDELRAYTYLNLAYLEEIGERGAPPDAEPRILPSDEAISALPFLLTELNPWQSESAERTIGLIASLMFRGRRHKEILLESTTLPLLSIFSKLGPELITPSVHRSIRSILLDLPARYFDMIDVVELTSKIVDRERLLFRSISPATIKKLIRQFNSNPNDSNLLIFIFAGTRYARSEAIGSLAELHPIAFDRLEDDTFAIKYCRIALRLLSKGHVDFANTIEITTTLGDPNALINPVSILRNMNRGGFEITALVYELAANTLGQNVFWRESLIDFFKTLLAARKSALSNPNTRAELKLNVPTLS